LTKILYISYDGLTDPLGQSQILPYLKGLAACGFQFTILSFEKKERFRKEKETVRKIIDAAKIKWEPLWFTSEPPVISKIYDRWKLRSTALKLQRKEKFDMVHCRSYVPAEIGLLFKKRFGTKFLFDMRGFWADEKRDSSWNVSNPFFRVIYNHYKKKETQYLRHADCIISLTNAGKNEMMRWPSYSSSVPIEVIPTCTDTDLFSLTDEEQKGRSREKLGISNDALVISYLGSIGTWYMIDEMLLFFKNLKSKFPSAKFLFITQTPPSVIEKKIVESNFDKADFIIREASRNEVPFMVKASDINISFIKPVYSKISSSPTKLGEVLAMGIPVICNSGVGDVEEIVRGTGSGFVIDAFKEKDFDEAIQAIPRLLQISPLSIRNAVKDIFSLQKGIESYLSCYLSISRKDTPVPAISVTTRTDPNETLNKNV